MRRLFSLLLLLAALLATAFPQSTPNEKTQSRGSITGHWILTADYLGTTLHASMDFEQHGDKLTGNFDGDKLEGSITGNFIHFVAKDDRGGSEEGRGTVQGDTMSGTVTYVDGSNPSHPVDSHFTAKLAIPYHSTEAPKAREFTPTVFYRQFSPFNKPVLTANPGDTIHTTTVDAGGNDEKGIPRVLGGNPETGPFYIESAEPGDTLVVHLTGLHLNRDWAMSDDSIVPRGLDSDLATKMKDGGRTILWHLDLERGMASPEKPAEHLAHYSVPVKPMLGCIATATRLANAPPNTGDSGYFGGNMDFNEVSQGNTVYLPVSVPGALLYVGDGHAVQGDGELNGNALETSMDVTFNVDVIHGKRVPGPRVESATHIMAMGLAGSLDEAFRQATANMADWLTSDYKLTPSELAQVLGSSSEYKIGEVADRNVGIVMKISKERLQSLVATK